MRYTGVHVGVAVCLLLALPVRADEILFTNGDRWTGKLVSLAEGKLKFEPDLVGALEVDVAKVLTFSTVEKAELHLSDGSVIVDVISSADAGTVRTQGAGATSSQSVSLAETVAINPAPPEEPGWEGKALAGGEFERGNTIKDSAYIETKVAYETQKQRIELVGSYDAERTTNRSTGASTTNDRNIYGRLLYDYFVTEKRSWFAVTSAEKDGPANLDLRFIAGGGLGYKFFNRDDFKLKVRFGPTWVHESFSTRGAEEEAVNSLVALDLSRKLAANLEFFYEGVYLQSLEKGDEQLIKTSTGLRTDINKHFFLEGKVLWEWDSQPAKGTERQDVDYIFGVGYKFF